MVNPGSPGYRHWIIERYKWRTYSCDWNQVPVLLAETPSRQSPGIDGPVVPRPAGDSLAESGESETCEKICLLWFNSAYNSNRLYKR